MDEFDRKLLVQLQGNCAQTNAELSERIHLSPSQISRRRVRLEADGIIARQIAVLDGQKLGYDIDVFIRIALTAHDDSTATKFAKFLKDIGEIHAAFAITGDADYLLHIKTRSLADLSALINRKLLPHPNVREVRSEIVLDCIKEFSPLDL